MGRRPEEMIGRSANEAQCIALPNMAHELNTEGITLAYFDKDPILRQRLKEFRHHYGQPAEVRREFVAAMGISGTEEIFRSGRLLLLLPARGEKVGMRGRCRWRIPPKKNADSSGEHLFRVNTAPLG